MRHSFFFHAPDGGTDAGTAAQATDAGGATTPTTTDGSGATPTETTPQTQTQQETPTYERPKWFAQVNPTKADSDDYKALYKHQKIDELADAYLAQGKELAALKEADKNAIHVPQKGDEEGIKAFKAQLGVPETADGYSLKSLSDKKLGIGDDIKKIIKDTAYGAMLSDRQAEAIGVSLVKVSKAALTAQKTARETSIKNFDSNLAASYKDISSETDRKATAEKDKATYETFAQESGIKDWLDDRGLSYDPTFVKAVAQYARKHSGNAPRPNLPNGSPSGKSNGNDAYDFYGKQFNDMYRRK